MISAALNDKRIGRGTAPVGTTTLGRWSVRSWVVPLVLAAVMLVTGFWVLDRMTATLRDQLRSKLTTILNTEVNAVRNWLGDQKRFVGILAGAPRLVEPFRAQAELSRRNETTNEALAASDPLAEIQVFLAPLTAAYGFDDFALVLPSGRNIGDSHGKFVGRPIDPVYTYILERVLAGETVVSPPMRPRGQGRASFDPEIVIAAPLHDGQDPDSAEVIGLIAFSLPTREFTEMLELAQPGATGETYAFDREGRMVSESRFTPKLAGLGLIEEGASAVLNLSVRDPGGDLTTGYKTSFPRLSQPLTRMAADAVAGNSGSDVEGYRDYRGRMVVGAWAWLDEYAMGIATEMDEEEAFRLLSTPQWILRGMIGILLLAALFLFVQSRRIFGLRKEIREAKQLGQYTLLERVGEGAMGEVYRASHAMLRRPTAIKLLRPDASTDQHVARFEREVQLTAQLTHPNTISIYDYGRSPEGAFYYAMEFLPGTTLDKLVETYGPQPEARVLHILKQAAGSLAEAHDRGLIHRDVKPANLMLCERGGVHDTLKVLDFGLVKDEGAEMTKLTVAGRILGTPLFLSPEAIQSPNRVDGRSDLYALGGVGYFVLTGEYVFEPSSVGEVLSKHLHEDPVPPSARLDRPVSKGLERVIMMCLEKDPADRPVSAGELLRMLAAIDDVGPWTNREVAAWAREHSAETA